MDTQNTNGTTLPVVNVEGQVAPKATKRIATPVIARRKVLQGKHLKIGAPRLPVIGLTVNRKRGAFTKADIFAANGETISMLTITHRITDLKKAGELCKMAEKAKHTGPGKPADQFSFDLTKAAPKKGRKGKTATATAPVVAAEPEGPPAQAPVEAPAPAPEPAAAAEAAV